MKPWIALLALIPPLAAACAVGRADDGFVGESKAAPRTTPIDASVTLTDPPDTSVATDEDAATPPEVDADATIGTTDAAPDVAPPPPPPPPPPTPPTVDGQIAAGEYGVHTNGANQQAVDPNVTTSTTWYMTWNDTQLFVGVAAADVAEGVVLYIDRAPLSPSNGGTNADGSLIGNAYDNTKGNLPFRADFVAYVKSGYNEYRVANGANGWSAPTVGTITTQGTGATREIAIPWVFITGSSAPSAASARPGSFAWLGYATSSGGYVYGPMPSTNPQGSVGQSATFGFYYKVGDTTLGVGSKPFATKLSP